MLANPPFGAERDQEAYPDVWGEYAKESETTILFVKLMFELLKPGGHCAVVVSEGFHTWDQFSAKALRKMLLDETSLKAVISLPQGLFVSKGGQGPKTSILLFEKGGKTDWVWFYKVTNDGYTMGTNRKEQKGNQLVECLTLFHQYVKQGNQPPESKYQFCIRSEWIKTLDPRIKEKILVETRVDMEIKGKKEREKKEKVLNKKIKDKKLTVAEKQTDLNLFDQMLENRIQNEIAKRIDKAHNYSFNLANYKSTLTDNQITDWKEALKHIQPNAATTIEEVYKKLKTGEPENSLPYLLKVNPVNALESDIAREYVNNLDNDLITKHKELYVIKEILKSGAKYPMVKLKDYLILNKNKIKPSKNPDVNYKVLGVSNEVGIFLNEILQPEETNQSYFIVSKNEFCYNPYRINVGSIGLNSFDFDNQIISGAYNVFACKEEEINPKYLAALFTSKGFLNYVNEKASGGVRMNFKFEDMAAWEIPLPSPEEQTIIIAQIEKQRAIIEGSEKVIKNWVADFSFIDFNKENWKEKSVGKICSFEYGKPLKEVDRIEGEYPVIGAGNIIGYHNSYFLDGPVISTGRRGATSGSIQWIDKKCFVIDTAFYIEVLNEKEVNKRFLFYSLKNLNLQKLQSGGAMPGINRNDVYNEKILLPNPETQRKIVDELDSQMQVLDGLCKMNAAAVKKISKILADVWGEEFVEPENEEIEDE